MDKAIPMQRLFVQKDDTKNKIKNAKDKQYKNNFFH